MNTQITGLVARSIVARTTLSIIGLAVIVGTLFAGMAAYLVQDGERARLETGLTGLLDTVQNTVSVACFVSDAVLARDVINGLLANDAVAGVRITAAGSVLHQRGVSAANAGGESYLAIERAVPSPFDASERVGTITLYASHAVLRANAWHYTRVFLAGISLKVALIALAVAIVVYNLVTRPIKRISDELHSLEISTGMQLQVPRRNAGDEIGRLVSDVNALIARLLLLIKQEHQLRLEREANERRLALIFEKVDTGLFEIDRNGHLDAWNPAFERILGTPEAARQFHSMVPEHEAAIQDLIQRALQSGEAQALDLDLSSDDAGTRWVELSLTPMASGSLQGVINDITQRKRAEMAAQLLAERNTLTGLLNRRGLEAGLKTVFERRHLKPSMMIAILMIDLDHFKPVNDTYGHKAGDAVLRHVARIMEHAVRRSDLVARPGGDEFTIALIDIESPEKAAQVATTLIERIADPVDIGEGVRVTIGASIGIAMAGPDNEPAESVIERADRALYQAKASGRGRYQFAEAPTAEQTA